MSARDISVIAVIGLWIVGIIVLAILALNFKRKHGIFIKFRDLQEQDFNESKATFAIAPVKITYDLPVGENCYFVGETLVFKKVTKISRSQRRYDKMLASRGFNVGYIDENDDDWADANFRKVFRAEKHQFSVIRQEFQKVLYQGKFYITNSRILIEGTDNSYQIPLSEVKSVQLSVFMYRGVYYNGIHISFLKNEYEFYATYDNIKMYFTLATLIEQKES